jgi:hypothetical protein
MGKYFISVTSKWITTFFALFCLVSCTTEPSDVPKKTFHIYMVFSPVSKDSINLARQFLVNAKDNVVGSTQIIVPNNKYTVGEICQSNQVDFPTPQLPVINSQGIQAVTSKIEKSLKEIKDGNKSCNADASALVTLSTNLNHASKKSEQLIIFIQAPWSKQEISEETLRQLLDGMTQLAQSGKVEKIVLFGINQDGSARLSKSFQAFNQAGKIQFESTTDTTQTIEFLKIVRKEHLGIK